MAGGRKVEVLSSRYGKQPSHTALPGTILHPNRSTLAVVCGDGEVLELGVRAEGRVNLRRIERFGTRD